MGELLHRWLCYYENTFTGLKRAVCQAPGCPSGGDCEGPVIDRMGASISYMEPLLRWSESCPAPHKGACWEMHISFNLTITASDDSGITRIGAHFAHETNNKRAFIKHWGPAKASDASHSHQLEGSLKLFVGPGKSLDLSIYEICAKDALDNESCVLPTKYPTRAKDLK